MLGGGGLKPPLYHRQKADPSLARTSREARADGTNLSTPQFRHPDNGSQIDHITGLNVLARTE